MNLIQDLRVLSRLLTGVRKSGTSHAERMENFYAGQAEDYDAFRQRLLPGRAELLSELTFPEQAVVVDLGGGTGANLEFLPATAHAKVRAWYLVDLASSLLTVAAERATANGWNQVHTVNADATAWQPEERADIVLFSYSLTMIPDWRAAIDNALEYLKPGGQLAVVDFTVFEESYDEGLQASSAFARAFWPRWFAWDGVLLHADHLPYLCARCPSSSLQQGHARLPYMPGSRVPFYRYIGVKT